MAVESVSLDEIKKARSVNAVTAEKKTQQIAAKKPAEFFVDKFSDKKIAEFFAPYGYFTHQKDNDGIVEVICNDCIIVFNDFSAYADATNWYNADENEQHFNFHRFYELCAKHNTTPSKAIADRLEVEVFNKMPYYVERKQKYTESLLNEVENDKDYGKLLSASVEKERLRESYSPLNKNFGSTNPEKIANVLSTLAPKD